MDEEKGWDEMGLVLESEPSTSKVASAFASAFASASTYRCLGPSLEQRLIRKNTSYHLQDRLPTACNAARQHTAAWSSPVGCGTA